jgi:sugar phosphate isomerase/epimerase
MAKFILSAFADEYSANFDEQLEGLKLNGINYMEIRGVDGKNISDLTEDELKAVKEKLDAAGIGVSSIGSPVGKIKVTDDFDAHLVKFRNCIKAAKILGTKNMRIFSFYIPEGMTREECRPEVMRRLGAMLEIAKAEDIYLCHENEKGIYGESPECCLDIQNEFDGEIKLIFDPANFIMDNHESYPHAFELLGDKIYYMHIKDATADKVICPAGKGIGGIPEIIDILDKKCACCCSGIFLTVEPHLKVFKGFDALEATGDKTIMPDNMYASNKEAFCAAVDAIKAIIAK